MSGQFRLICLTNYQCGQVRMWLTRPMWRKSKLFAIWSQYNYHPQEPMLWKKQLKRSIDIVNTVKQRQALVTCDLAIAKIAKRIQSGESPVYDNLFITFGSFHIELSFFFIAWKIYWRFRWTVYPFWMWYCSNAIHEQIFERQDIQSM